jgi:DNA mismatch repair protein MSH3
MGKQQMVLSSFFAAKKPKTESSSSSEQDPVATDAAAAAPVARVKRTRPAAAPGEEQQRPQRMRGATPSGAAAAAAAVSSSPPHSAPANPSTRDSSRFDNIPSDPRRERSFGEAIERMHSRAEQRQAGTEVAAGGDHTPLEKQVLALQQKHRGLGCLLAIEVGYKFMFYGGDAKAAAEVLSIVAYPKGHFIQAGVPTARLKFHLRRLVEAGHKVGVVRQVSRFPAGLTVGDWRPL